MNERNENAFAGYEYIDVSVSPRMAQTYIDCYENFGWNYEGKSTPFSGAAIAATATALSGKPLSGVPAISLRFRRDRKILNKVELTRLGYQFNSCVKQIEAMEKSKTLNASIVAYSIGVLGSVALVGAVFAFLGQMLLLGIILAIPGIAGWVLPYFCYSRISKAKTAQVTSYIEQKYDEIYEVCEKAHRLLS